jgi:hypothetical protein
MIDRKTLEDLAREAAETCGKRAEYHCDRAWLERFAALVRAQALDEAAAIADATYVEPGDMEACACVEAGDAIRALKEST